MTEAQFEPLLAAIREQYLELRAIGQLLRSKASDYRRNLFPFLLDSCG